METAQLQQLAARAAKGESAAWETLYREIGKISASVCRQKKLSQEDAEDVTQEASLALSGRLKELAAMDNPEGYIRRVVNSKSIDLIRFASKTPVDSMHEDEDYVLNLPDASATPENKVAGLSADSLIDDFINELPEEQREALVMRYCDGYTNAQIAEKLNVPPGTVASRVRYGKKTLEKRIEKYEKENNIRLHAKFAFPFLPWRMFRNQSLQTVEIIAADGGSSTSGGTRALTGLLATVVFGGAVIGTGFVMKGSNTPADEVVPTQAVTEHVEQIDPTAATVYKDVYETQVATVYQTVNSAQNGGQLSGQNKSEQPEQNKPAQTEQTLQGLPDEFMFAGNRYEPSELTLTSKTYHSHTLQGTLTFPDSWVDNVEIDDNGYHITVIDKGSNTWDYQNCILDIFCYSNLSKSELTDNFNPYTNTLSFSLGYSKLPGAEVYDLYECSLSWNQSVLYRTNLDYSNINREIISVLESYHPDNLIYTSLLTQQKKDAVMKFTGSDPIQVP